MPAESLTKYCSVEQSAERCLSRRFLRRFTALQDAIGPVAKTALLADWLRTVDPESGNYIVRIMTGDLRIGLKEGLLEEAIAAAFGASLEQVKEVNMLTGDIGETARLAKNESALCRKPHALSASQMYVSDSRTFSRNDMGPYTIRVHGSGCSRRSEV